MYNVNNGLEKKKDVRLKNKLRLLSPTNCLKKKINTVQIAFSALLKLFLQ